jgi:hypothetical protein
MKNTPPETDKPPILGNWNRMYILVLLVHTLLILFFYWFTKHYN